MRPSTLFPPRTTLPPAPAPEQNFTPALVWPATELPPETSIEIEAMASAPVVPVQFCIIIMTMPPLPPPLLMSSPVLLDGYPFAIRYDGPAFGERAIDASPEITMVPPPSPP